MKVREILMLEMADMYGSKEETGDEDFYPFVLVQMSIP
jgi:hypothetical protein